MLENVRSTVDSTFHGYAECRYLKVTSINARREEMLQRNSWGPKVSKCYSWLAFKLDIRRYSSNGKTMAGQCCKIWASESICCQENWFGTQLAGGMDAFSTQKQVLHPRLFVYISTYSKLYSNLYLHDNSSKSSHSLWIVMCTPYFSFKVSIDHCISKRNDWPAIQAAVIVLLL